MIWLDEALTDLFEQLDKVNSLPLPVYQALNEAKNAHADFKERVEKKTLILSELKWYRFYWLGNKAKTEGEGYVTGQGSSPEDAFSKLGYGGGASAALDYYDVVPEKESPYKETGLTSKI